MAPGKEKDRRETKKGREDGHRQFVKCGFMFPLPNPTGGSTQPADIPVVAVAVITVH